MKIPKFFIRFSFRPANVCFYYFFLAQEVGAGAKKRGGVAALPAPTPPWSLLGLLYLLSDFSNMASFSLFCDSYQRILYQGFYYMLMSLIRVCLVFHFPLSGSDTSLSFFADAGHAPQMLENYGGILKNNIFLLL